MPPQTLVKRVAILEHTMQSLEGLPDRVASLEVQFVQFRVEVREEFSAVRGEIRRLGETLRGEMHDFGETLRGEMAGGLNGLERTLRGEMHDFGEALRGEMAGGLKGLEQTLRGEIRIGDEETRRQMRVLHEEVITRIALLDEHLNGRKRSPEPRGRTGHSRRAPKR